MSIKISVVIPVYKAAGYVEQAVVSAIAQPQVSEIILVEDRSPDNSLAVCKELVNKYGAVRLVQHPGGENRGAGASRNLGIQYASNLFVAFLDADDYYLPNRFLRAEEIVNNNPDVDGIYEAVSIFKEGEEQSGKLYTITKSDIPPTRLFHFLLRGTFGHFSTDAILVKKSLFRKAGDFNVDLRLHQDSELWLRLAYYGKLCAGSIDKPVTMARRHDNNRITHASIESRLYFWSTVKNYYSSKEVKRIDLALIIWKYSGVLALVNKRLHILEFLKLLIQDFGVVRKLIIG